MNAVAALLGSRLRRPRSLSAAELRELWALRMSQLQLQPDVDEAADFKRFVADYQHPGIVWVLRQRGRVVGTYLQRILLTEHRGQRRIVLAPDYVFMAEHLRGHPVLLLAVIALTLLPLLRHPWRRAVATGGVYPSAYIAWARLVQPCWSLGDPRLTDEQRALVADLGPKLWGEAWIGDGTLRFRTVPTPSSPRSERGRALLALYESVNPSWRAGRALFFVTPLGLGTVWGGVSRSARASFAARRRTTAEA